MKQILLFGDSLTQRGFHDESFGQCKNGGDLAPDGPGWVARLASAYARRADICCRGYGGYTTEWCKYILPQLLPVKQEHENNAARVSWPPSDLLLAVIWLGANDAVLPGCKQHTPVAQYQQNLALIVQHVRTFAPNAKIILLTPPAVHPPTWERHCLAKGRPLDRSVEHTRKYAEALVSTAKQLRVACANIYAAMDAFAAKEPEQDTANNQEQGNQEQVYWARMQRLLCDGLHFSPRGNQLVFQTLMETIQREYPEALPEALSMQFPYHEHVDPWQLQKCIRP